MDSQIILDKPSALLYSVLTLNKEIQMKTEIRIVTKANGKKAAYYRNPNSRTWFHMTVKDAEKALLVGKAHIGINKNVAVVG
jgi:hypothetical protein